MKHKIIYTIVVLFIGMLLGGTISWAASRVVLVNGNGVEYSASNPIYINGV